MYESRALGDRRAGRRHRRRDPFRGSVFPVQKNDAEKGRTSERSRGRRRRETRHIGARPDAGHRSRPPSSASASSASSSVLHRAKVSTLGVGATERGASVQERRQYGMHHGVERRKSDRRRAAAARAETSAAARSETSAAARSETSAAARAETSAAARAETSAAARAAVSRAPGRRHAHRSVARVDAGE